MYRWVSVGFSYKLVYSSLLSFTFTVVSRKSICVGLVSCVKLNGRMDPIKVVYKIIKFIFTMCPNHIVSNKV